MVQKGPEQRPGPQRSAGLSREPLWIACLGTSPGKTYQSRNGEQGDVRPGQIPPTLELTEQVAHFKPQLF